ncbi:hypothetical protein WMW72_12060 [Paenibacillus filicis]|uniref:Uncharacterized protein n=1 Tax=Paenibacillus filicis TaxID=669464 RepID=A0ABU9DK79_9BACL
MSREEVCVGVEIGCPFPEVGKPLILDGFGNDDLFVPESITKIEWKIYDDVKRVQVYMYGVRSKLKRRG